jgi:hypothetical protein
LGDLSVFDKVLDEPFMGDDASLGNADVHAFDFGRQKEKSRNESRECTATVRYRYTLRCSSIA